MPRAKRSGRPWGPIRAENAKAHELAQFLRKQVEASGKTLTDLSREINFSKSLISANLSGAIPKPEFLKSLIGATEQSHGMRSKKIQHALVLRDAARAAPSKSAVQLSGATGQQDVTQSLIRSLQDQVALERALRSAIQLNWALLWQMGSGSSSTALNENSDEGNGDELSLPVERSGQSAGERPPFSLVRHGAGGDASSSVGRERIALHDLSPAKLETMVQELFDVMGFAAWTHNSFSGDRGFDAVAINEDPVMGGPVLIQVKRIKRPVSIEHIMSLVGAVESERATKGVLVATSHFTSDAREYAARTGRIQLIDGRSLQSLLFEHLGVEVEL